MFVHNGLRCPAVLCFEPHISLENVMHHNCYCLKLAKSSYAGCLRTYYDKDASGRGKFGRVWLRQQPP